MSDHRGGHAEFGYTHRFSDVQSIDANVSYNHWGGPSWNSYEEDETWPGADGDRTETSYREQTMPINVNTWEAKLDYSNVFNQYLKLEAGYNGNYSHENTPNSTWRGTSVGIWSSPRALQPVHIYKQHLRALFHARRQGG